ncbi:MAG: OmpA family protein [Pasteurellaceae bacterium]|nr:OmpA family protein [Pasteurellaceae bacterium]
MVFFSKKKQASDHQWLTISDLMSGLMILFIFIAISFMRSALLEKERANEELKKFQEIESVYTELAAQRDKALQEKLLLEKDLREANQQKEKALQDKILFEQELMLLLQQNSSYQEQKENAESELYKIRHIAEAYQNNQEAIHKALEQAFPQSLLAENQLNAEIDGNTLTFIFKSSDSLFDNASANLKEDYKKALSIFFPKYIKAITPYKESIQEIRIEGHTSSEWGVFPKEIKYQSAKERRLYSYFENMKLSQARTNSVLQFVLSDLKAYIPEDYHQWLTDHTAAVGLSFSKPILNAQGKEDIERSRRVTFRIITNADIKIQEILQKESN